MSETEKTEKKDSFVKKVGGWFGLALAFLVGTFFLDQGEIFGETVPTAWTSLKLTALQGLKKAQKLYWRSTIWVRDMLKVIKWITLGWWSLSGILLVLGMMGRAYGWNEHASLALRLIGIYLFAAYWLAAATIAKTLYYGVHGLKNGAYSAARAIGQSANHWLGHLGIETPVPAIAADDAEKLEEGAKEFQRFFFTVAAAVLVLGTFFAPSGDPVTAVGLALIVMPLAAMKMIASKYDKWNTERGWKLISAAVLVGFVVLTLTIFGRGLVPEPIRAWFSRRNQSELIVLVLFAIPSALWLTAAFWKGKSADLSVAAKRLSWVCGVLIAFLWIKGSISSKELSGHEVMSGETKQDLGEIHEAATHKTIDGMRKAVDLPPKYGTASGSTNLAPPRAQARPEAPQPQVTVQNAPRARTRIVVPPAEAPKQYRSPGQALDDLDDTGY